MKTLKDIRQQFFSELKGEFPDVELESMFELLVDKHLQLGSGIDTDADLELDHEKQQKFDTLLARVKQNEPIQYIIGETKFYGRSFKVNSHVHVPRPETETMVSWVIEDYPLVAAKSEKKVALLDIGTGCGLLPVTLAKELPLEATAVDISENALEVARENAQLNNAEVHFIHDNVLGWDALPRQFDIIVSNPPYILEKAKKDVQRKILDYEPSIALYVQDEDPMIFNRKIAALAKASLSPHGIVYVEINQYLGAETAQVFAENGFKTEIRKDVFGNERTVKAFRN